MSEYTDPAVIEKLISDPGVRALYHALPDGHKYIMYMAIVGTDYHRSQKRAADAAVKEEFMMKERAQAHTEALADFAYWFLKKLTAQ